MIKKNMYIQDNHLNNQENQTQGGRQYTKTSYKYLSVLKYAALYSLVNIPNSTRV